MLTTSLPHETRYAPKHLERLSGRNTRNQAELALMPVVLVAFDADEAGQTATRWWFQKLENTYGLRPTAHNVNEMLLHVHDIRKWIKKGIHDYHQQDACPTINP